jgi:ABC-2 type transport system permease protein
MGPPATKSPELLAQIGVLGKRSVRRTTRQIGLLVFPLVFPILLWTINGSSLAAATHIPGFPHVGYRDFILSVAFVQGALFVSITAGTDLARDIESGFLNRLALTPIRGEALLAGQLGGPLVLAGVQTVTYILIGFVGGVSIVSGVGGVVVLFLLSVLVAFAFAGLGCFIALRSGSGEAVQAIFPLLFVTLFLSSGSLPRPLIQVTWFRDVATYNPVSYLIEGLRSLIITGWDARALAMAFGFAAVIAVVSLVAAGAAMRTRLVRT